jgi:hypothetical protein
VQCSQGVCSLKKKLIKIMDGEGTTSNLRKVYKCSKEVSIEAFWLGFYVCVNSQK